LRDENPLCEPEGWRAVATERLRVPFWTVDADVIVPAAVLKAEV
jgi:deoxyribodipyrimidine photo-lyase